MIITATPQPENFPPRIRLDIDSGGDEFLELSVLRDGRPIRQQPAVMGLSETFVYDYEAPLGVPVTYTASGSTVSDWGSAHAETWASLTGWTTVEGAPVVTLGRLKDGTVTRDDVPVTVGRLSLASGSWGVFSLRIGPISVVGDGSVRSVRFRGGRVATIPLAGTAVVEWTTSAAAVTHGGSSPSPLVPGSDTASPAIVARAGERFGTPPGYTFSYMGELAAFSYAEPATTLAASASTTTQIDSPEAWLIHPIQPTLSVPIERPSAPHLRGDIGVEASTDDQRTYAARQVIYQPSGRREAVVFPTGYRSAGNWTLVLQTHTIDARNDMLNLLDDQAPVLLRSPADAAWDLADGWYAVGDVTQARPVNIGDVEYRLITLPLTKVAEPPVKIAPQLTWGDLMLRGVTWGDMLSHTWLDVLMGEV